MWNIVVSVVVVSLFLTETGARSVEKTDEELKGSVEKTDEAEKGHICVINGTEYKEGDELPTRGKCWHCTCTPGFSKPGPEVCARISCPFYGNNGCKPVYSEGECCPVAWDCEDDSLNNTKPISCNEQFFQHYKVKQCKAVHEEGNPCPIRFDCPAEFLTDDTVCYHDDKTYKLGESVPSSNPCLICSCESSFDGGAGISCISVECPSVFGAKEYKEGCYPTFTLNSCCSVGESCDQLENGTLNEPLCEMDGKLYHAGQQMYPKDQSCLTCLCDENWNGISNSSCRQIDCMIEKRLKRLKEGCIPIYHESSCCPIEYHCDSSDQDRLITDLSLSNSEPDPAKQCVFKDKRGNVGDILILKRSNNCVTCKCSTPPDFTCIHKTCPHPPNDDYENCKPIFTPGECCAKYECIQQAAPSQPLCDPVYCREGCREVMIPFGCPMCSCQDVLCSPPRCGQDCVIDYSASPCPACKCAETFPLDRPMCGPVKCGPQCHEAISPQGCPMCVCGPLCSPPKCETGCHVVTAVAEGHCPYCICDHDEDYETDLPDRARRVLCSPVRCPLDCREGTGENGCPLCLCDPLCSPPRCDPGCREEVVPAYGPCPGCVCDQSTTDILQCSLVKCPEGCTEFVPRNSCPICQCQNVLCSMPKCPIGCEINRNPAPGTCPHCQCPDTIPLNRPLCGPVKCGPGCSEGISPQGCPMCVCGPLCSPPKCDPGCQLQKDVAEGQCPGCDCSGERKIPDRLDKILCAPVRCPVDCREATGQNGCPMCMCDPLCSPPKCDPGCRAEVAPRFGPCPGCVCDKVERPQCGPVHCGLDCYESVSPQGCPTCICGPQCSPPKCPVGCFVETNVPVGHCPGCECPRRAPSSEQEDCPPGCQTEEKDGASQCICQPLCSMPQCSPDCPLVMDVPAGSCPYCDCPLDKADRPVVDSVMRSPVMRSPVMRSPAAPAGRVIPAGPLGRVGPATPLQCSPPKCDPGCVMQKNVPIGSCPGCDCPMQSRSVAVSDPPVMPPSVQCLPGCRKVIGVDGSVRCACAHCATPRCPSACTLSYPIGSCPTCDCAKQEAFSWCPPVNGCEEGCRMVTTSNGCDACKCGDVCVPPKCPPGCEVEVQSDPDKCPDCRCEIKRPQEMRCPDMPCQLPCQWVRLSENVCPMCECGGLGMANQGQLTVGGVASDGLPKDHEQHQ